MNRHRLCLGVVALFLTGMVAGIAPAAGIEATEMDDLDPDATVLEINLEDDGTAYWRIEHRYRLADEDQEQAFASLQQDIEENESAFLDQFTQRMESTVVSAAETTGRDMAVQNASVTAETRSLPQDYGVVTYRFEWTEFAERDGDRLVAGDALTGLFLDAETRLLVTWADPYALERASPDPTDRRETAVTWRVPVEFGPDEPRVVLATGATGSTVTQFIFGSYLGYGLLVLLTVAGGGAVALGLRWLRSESQQRDPTTETPGTEEESTAVEAATADGLLSNEEQVVRLLEENGGRIKQQDVVQTLGWTDAKTSQVVNELREQGRVESFRLGRENVLKLTDKANDSST